MTEFVLVLNWAEQLGGVQTATRSLAEALRGEGASVRVVSAFPGGADGRRGDDPALYRSVPWRRLPRRLRAVVGDTRWGRIDGVGRRIAVRRLEKIARGAEVVVAMDVFAAELVARADLPGSRRFAQYHNTFSNIDGTRDLDRLTRSAGAFDGLVALTDADAAGFRRRLRIPVHSVPNALPAPVIGGVVHPDGAVVGLGRYTTVKNFSLLVDAWAGLSEATREGWRLDLHGDGPERANLARRAADVAGVSVRTPTTDPQAVLRAAAVLVLPSEHEGLPMVLLEAMAAGVACIATRSSPGVEELLGDGAGWLVPRGDADRLAQALTSAMTDRQERERRCAVAAERVSSYSPSRVARRWLEIAGTPVEPVAA